MTKCTSERPRTILTFQVKFSRKFSCFVGKYCMNLPFQNFRMNEKERHRERPGVQLQCHFKLMSINITPIYYHYVLLITQRLEILMSLSSFCPAATILPNRLVSSLVLSTHRASQLPGQLLNRPTPEILLSELPET